jgi:hypothetical protein
MDTLAPAYCSTVGSGDGTSFVVPLAEKIIHPPINVYILSVFLGLQGKGEGLLIATLSYPLDLPSRTGS